MCLSNMINSARDVFIGGERGEEDMVDCAIM